ncbi:uncharacterized protein LOC117120795 [Anneissia japonica]|uniref:uncharacterized protein LOC117120795 n=1 Tax=Anneissia japonica TaxID=1529436 RepID=UPI0014258C8F|nr:uncharacterized protein LOC117120795 [Anneissia japonica]
MPSVKINYQNVKKHYQEDGFSEITKYLTGAKNCRKALDFKGVLHFAAFIKRYASEHGLVLPGRIPGLRKTDADTVLLSSSETKIHVCTKFNAARKAFKPDAPEVSYKTFCRYWKELFPNIVIAKPRSDLCRTCQVNTTSIMRSSGVALIQKAELIRTAQYHLELAMEQRRVYNEMIVESKEQLKGTSLGCHAPMSFNGMAHYGFDFAQQIMFPSDPMQAGPIYFLTPRKCQIFGMCCTGLTKQVNYLVDEAQIIKKGSEFVVNLIHHFLERWGIGETIANFHCDNCCAQNKNQH